MSKVHIAVKSWMQRNVAHYATNGEVDGPAMVDKAIEEYGLPETARTDENHWVWDLAVAVALAYERTHLAQVA